MSMDINEYRRTNRKQSENTRLETLIDLITMAFQESL
mgnify:CR=1 FL=1